MLGPPCKHCGSDDVRLTYPAKFSVEDKYAKYRREMKRRIKEQEEKTSQ